MNWLDVIKNDIDKLDDFINEYRVEYEAARKDIKIEGKIVGVSQTMPMLFEKRYAQFEDINSVVSFLETEVARLRSKHFRIYNENYSRALSSRDIEKYVDGEVEVVEAALRLNKALLLRNKFAGITKALDSKQYQISNIVKLKVAGLDDSEIGF